MRMRQRPRVPEALVQRRRRISRLERFSSEADEASVAHIRIGTARRLGDFIAPGDFATIYDVNALYTAGIDGTGQKLAVMGQTDIYLADLNDFRSGFGLSSLTCTTNAQRV